MHEVEGAAAGGMDGGSGEISDAKEIMLMRSSAASAASPALQQPRDAVS